jgi:hypothetical protein
MVIFYEYIFTITKKVTLVGLKTVKLCIIYNNLALALVKKMHHTFFVCIFMNFNLYIVYIYNKFLLEPLDT